MKAAGIKPIKHIPDYVQKIIDEYYGEGNEHNRITVGHKHKWDGGCICNNGYTSSIEEFYADTDRMRSVICDIAQSEGAEEIKIFAAGSSFFEDKSDIMSFEIVKDILPLLKAHGTDHRDCRGIMLDVHNGAVGLFIAGAFNYLVRCALVISEEIVILPTHNFEFEIYCGTKQESIAEFVRRYDFLDIYE